MNLQAVPGRPAMLDQANCALARTQTHVAADTARHKEHRQHAAQEKQRLVERMTSVASERDQARREARRRKRDAPPHPEAAARLQGQADAMHEQLVALTSVIRGSAPGAGGRRIGLDMIRAVSPAARRLAGIAASTCPAPEA